MRKSSDPLDPVVVGFIREQGRFPSGFELMMLREAQASVALDHGEVSTYAVDSRAVEAGGTPFPPAASEEESDADQ